MRSVPVTAVVSRSNGADMLRVISLALLLLVVLVVLFWSSAAATNSATVAVGDPETPSTPAQNEGFEQDEANDDEESMESVTMSIPLEEGGVIDVDAPEMELKIEKWDGDEVLVIVEKPKRSRAAGKTALVEPVNIKVTRRGKDVRIETTGGVDWSESGMDLSFRILLPERCGVDSPSDCRGETLARMTGVLWRAIHREALKWLVR